jgi:hypothetical protein
MSASPAPSHNGSARLVKARRFPFFVVGVSLVVLLFLVAIGEIAGKNGTHARGPRRVTPRPISLTGCRLSGVDQQSDAVSLRPHRKGDSALTGRWATHECRAPR